jgi:SlyX protein
MLRRNLQQVRALSNITPIVFPLYPDGIMAAFAQGHAVSSEDRFVDIETKLAHQEDLVDELNKVVYQQTRRIDQLEALVNQLAEHIRNNAQSGQPGNEPPPHY